MQREHAQIMKITNGFFNPISAFAQTNLIIELILIVYLFSKKLGTEGTNHLTCRWEEGLWFFASFRKKFPDNMRVIIFIFFVAQSAFFFLQNLTLGYMTKTLKQILFSLHQNQNIFFSNIGNQNT
jgi:TRAP-type C4-dicarboxylate transport system permease large subunit